MQRVEPSKIHDFAEASFTGDLRKHAQAPLELVNELPPVEATRVHIPEDSGSALGWGTFFFCVFWLGGISAYIVGLIGWAKIFELPLAWYGLLIAVLIVPVALAIFIAILAREAKILRGQSAVLAMAAAELTEPEDHAARGMAKLGRAIRRELDTFNAAVETATARMATLETTTNERLQLIERTAIAAQERVERATGKLGSEREKLAHFTQALDTAVLAASDTLTARLQEARTAARNASESLHTEHGAIAGLISTLQNASATVSNRAAESAKEIERQSQRLDAASEAAAARSEQVVARHERQRAALAETIERLKQENDHMARALDFQREGLTKLVGVMVEETKKIGTFTIEGSRRLDETAAIMAQRIVETTQLFTRESEKLRTSTELTTSGLEQAMQTIRSAGDSSFDAAGRLGSVLISLRETAANASQHIEGTVDRLGKLAQQMPAASPQTHQLRAALDQQAEAARDLSSRVTSAFDRVRQAEPEKPQAPLRQQPPVPNFNVPPQANLAPPPRNQVPPAPPASSPEAADPQRGWFGRAKRFVRPTDNIAESPDDRSGWDMKSLLAAAENEATKPPIQHQPLPPHRPAPQPQQPRVVELRADQVVPESTVKRPPHPATPSNAKGGEHAATSSRHMIETLQAMAIDLDRFLEDDPPLDLLRRYRNGERNVFARRLVSILGREQAEAIGRKYAEDGEFRETVDRYILQFEALMEQTAKSDRENVLVETYLTSQTGKVYVALASAIGRLS
jgi:methyl-accepting chemotaxis protein